MGSKILSYGETAIIKSALHKKTTNINKIEINRIVLFSKTSYDDTGSFKYYIGYRHTDGNLSPPSIRLPQLTGYAKHFNDEDKVINFLVADKKIVKNTMKYGEKLKACLEKNLIKILCMKINILLLN